MKRPSRWSVPSFIPLAKLALAAALALAAVSPAQAAELARSSRPVADIHRVVLGAVGELEITQGESESLVVEAEEHLLRLITTEVNNRTLKIDIAGREFRTREPVRFRLQVRQLSGVEVTGSGNARIAPLVTDRLQVVVSGSGNVRFARLTAESLAADLSGSGDLEIVAGQVGRQQVRIDGAARYLAPALRARDVRIEIDGSGDAALAAEKSLDARISGSGRVLYRGDPIVTQTIEGAGTLDRARTR